MKLRTIGATCLLALSVTACGASDEDKASKAISQSVREGGNETFQVTKQEADCVGDGMVEEIGVDQLVKYKIITDDMKATDNIDSVKMSEGDAESAADVMQECADIKKVFTDAMGGLPEEAKACVEEALTDDVVHEFLVAVFMNDQQEGTRGMMTALQECVTQG